MENTFFKRFGDLIREKQATIMTAESAVEKAIPLALKVINQAEAIMESGVDKSDKH
jgi:hypothetical protein